MADTPITVAYIAGQTALIAKIGQDADSAIEESVSLTESVTRPGTYTGTVTGAIAGDRRLEIWKGTAKLADTFIRLVDDAGPYAAGSLAARPGDDVNVTQVAGVAVADIGDFKADVSGVASQTSVNAISTRTQSVADKDEILSRGNTAWVTAVVGAFPSVPTATDIRIEMDANSTQLAAALKTGVEYVHTQNAANVVAKTANVTITEAA